MILAMKKLNLVISQRPESDYQTGDPIRETGYMSVSQYPENQIPKDSFLYVIKLGDKHCNTSYGNAFDINCGILNFAPTEILTRVKESTAKIIISWPMESFLSPDLFSLMHQYFFHHKIPFENVIYLSCCSNGQLIYDRYCDENNITEKMIMEYIPWYMYNFANFHSQQYVIGEKSKKFFSMNRRMHPQRTMLFRHIHKNNLLKDFFFSFPLYHPDSGEKFSQRVLRDYPHLISKEEVIELEKLLPLKLDIVDWKPYPLPIKSEQLDRFYNNSLFSIVCETYFYSDIIHLTEKTFKPIINNHPFIMVSSPYTLQTLKSFGFKTFDSIIDETYDTIENHDQRFKAILNLIDDICKWSPEKTKEISAEVKDIVDFNYSLIKTRKKVELNNFIEKYGV